MILLDTNVVSELVRTAPSVAVVDWINANSSQSAISTITVFELNIGIARLPDSKRRDALRHAIARIIRRFGPNILSFDVASAHAAVELAQRARSTGKALYQRDKLPDLQLAGIAAAYGLPLATRNVADFEGLGIDLINPWETS